MQSTSHYVDPDSGAFLEITGSTFDHDAWQKANPTWRGPFATHEQAQAVHTLLTSEP